MAKITQLHHEPPATGQSPLCPASEVYLRALRPRAVQVLGLMDREQFSRTFGCFDRTYWAWKFTDFPGARFQEGLCFLGFLYATAFEGNDYHRSENLLKWLAAGFDFWSAIQRPGGDFDEAYPYEHSLAATAFTSFYLSEAWNFVGEELPDETGQRFRAALTRAGDWLVRNDETHGFLSNHLAATAAALLHASRITGEARFEERSRHFLDKILDRQSDEGWYDEYGGADPGYQTHGSFYLARYLALTERQDLQESLERSFRFLSHFVHPDRSLGGEYASRNTQTYYPAAFEMMSTVSGAARWIADEMRPAVETMSAAGLGSVDAYNLFPLLNNYVFAYLAAEGRAAEAAPAEGPPGELGVYHFPEAGLLKVRKLRYDLYVGLTKGGVLKLFDRDKRTLRFSNCGYVGRLDSGAMISNQWLDKERSCRVTDGEIRIDGAFYQVSRPVMTPPKFLLFRLFSLTAGRFQKAAAWLKALLVKVLIYRKKEFDLRFSRRILLHDDGIEILDDLAGDSQGKVAVLIAEQAFSTIHMGSARYFVPGELVAAEPAAAGFHAPVPPAVLPGGVERHHRVTLD